MANRPTTARALKRYREKRNFVRTPEPSGKTSPPSLADQRLFVIQKHAASRLHYDFRLELDGTLKSWAVPKGPSLDPSQKRLAVHVEDHPLEYANFEGIIPTKQYGAGTVLIWDRGTWDPVGDPRAGYRQGVLKFRLDGQKLQGAWTLVRMHRRGEDDKDNWLLIKEQDDQAKKGTAGDIVALMPDSVESGQGVEQVAKGQPRVWQSNRRRTGDSPPPSTPRQDVGGLSGAVKAECPDWIAPQLASLVDRMPDEDSWIHEIKYDGYRIVARVRDGEVRLFTRNQNEWTAKLKPQVDALASLRLSSAWLDGEAAVFTEEGKTDFQALQNAFDLHAPRPIVYCVFDVMYANGYDLRQVPLLERKRLLASLISGHRSGLLRYSDHIEGSGQAAFAEACRRGLEGLISKRADALYRSGRGRNWLKVKCEQRQEFVIGGYTDPAGSRKGFGALLVGVYQGDRLTYAGKVGTGYTETSLKELHGQLKRLEQARPPFVNPPTGYDAKGAHWVKPTLVAEVRFAEWTKEGILRQPSFQGLRQDKRPQSIIREYARPPDASAHPTDAGDSHRNTARAAPASTTKSSAFKLTHPERVLFPDIGLTKEGLARFYQSVGKWILPHLQGRPLTLVRCPQGYQDCFYQKHVNETVPRAIGRIEIEEDGGRGTYMVADTIEAVLGLVQMGVLELHTWGATREQLDRPDRLTFDLDPDPSVPWAHVIEAAQLTRALLKELGLVSFVKTTGGKGLHIVAPIQRTHNWEQAKAFSKSVAEHLVRTIPQRFTANMAKRVRKGKIFIDYLRNARGATAIAAYSTRAKPGAPVSVPLSWEELSAEITSDSFTVSTVPDRLKRLKQDPWGEYGRVKQRLTDRMSQRLRMA